MAMSETTTAGTTVGAEIAGSSDIILKYNGMRGNQPASYGNTAFLWQEPQIIPYSMPPMAAQPIPTNAENGAVLLKQPAARDAAVHHRICRRARGYEHLFVGIDCPQWLDLDVPDFGSGGQRLPANGGRSIRNAGRKPAPVYRQWIGLWQGPEPSYTIPPIASVAVASNHSRGSIELQAMIVPGMTYSVGYFMGQPQTTLAASCTFS
jgi:hypothetical protein